MLSQEITVRPEAGELYQKRMMGQRLCYDLVQKNDKIVLTVSYGEEVRVCEWKACFADAKETVRSLFDADVTPCALAEILEDLGCEIIAQNYLQRKEIVL